MPLLVIERNFAERLEVDDESVRAIEDTNGDAVVEVTPPYGTLPA